MYHQIRCDIIGQDRNLFFMSAVDILRYLNYLRVERNFSRHTLRAYSNDLGQFSDYMENGPAGVTA